MNPTLPAALFPPSVQLTAAVAGPGRRVLGFQVQLTLPSAPAVWLPARALLVEREPLA